MKVLEFTQSLMKASGILPTFNGNPPGKWLEVIKLTVFLVGPFYATTTTFAFGIRHFDDLRLLTSSMYISIGCTIAITMQISLWHQSKNVQQTLEQLESLVNERMKTGDFERGYCKTEHDLNKFTKTIGICWASSIAVLSSGPFASALMDYFTGNYTILSWQLLYPTLNPWDMTNERNVILTVIFQCCWAAPTILFLLLVPQFLFVAITQYFDASIQDVKALINSFNYENIIELKQKFTEMINLHWKSLMLIENYNQIMSTSIFIGSTFNLICMCTILFQFKDALVQALERRDYAVIQLALTSNFVLLQLIFSFCYLGDRLTSKAFEVNGAIYDCDWYNYPPNIQRFTILIMRRAQTKFVMTGYSLVSCNLQSFKAILNFVTSAFLLLIKISE